MQIVIVGGPHSGVGKTLAAEIAIRTLSDRRVGAIKLTVADGERDPRHDHGASAAQVALAAGICGRGASCGVCETVHSRTPSRLITHQGAIYKQGTDTCRLADAGAIGVVWVISLREAAPAALDAATLSLTERGANTIVIEGTTALEWLQPDASVLVATDPGRTWKQVALTQVGHCDIVLRNLVPAAVGTQSPPAAFFACEPLNCNLGDPGDAGTRHYVALLRAKCGVKTPRESLADGVRAAG